MPTAYEQVLDVVGEHPGRISNDIVDLAADRGVTDTDIREILSEAIGNDDLVVFDGRYWVMRIGKYRFNRYDHPET